jgi:hypothetical protein
MDAIFASLPLWVLLPLLLTGLIVAEMLGRAARGALSRRAGPSNASASPGDGNMEHIVSSVFALLGLLIAFTFSLALDRYETRSHLVVEEANAIGTAYIRAAFAAEAERVALRQNLRAYAGNRLAYGQARFADRPPLAEQGNRLRAQLADRGLAASWSVTLEPLAPAVIASVNEVIDVGGSREAANLAKIPATVALMLVFYAHAAAFVLGYAYPAQSRIQRFGHGVLLCVLSLSLVTIFDLDRPASGTIKVSQQPLIDLIASFGPAPPATPQ